MKKNCLLLAFWFYYSLIFSQCYMDFVPMDCYVPQGISLDSMMQLVRYRYQLEWSGHADLKEYSDRKNDYYSKEFREKWHKFNPDSLFRFSRQYISGKLGEDIFCRRVRMEPESFKAEREKIIFIFQFHYKDIECWNGTKADIQMVFKKNKDGTLTFLPPENLPDCTCNPQDCTFKMLDYPKAVDIAEQTGLLDIATPYDVDTDTKNHRIVITTAAGDCEKRYIGVDMRTGDVVQDTVYLDKRTLCYDWKSWAKNANLVVEATAIAQTKGYRVDNWIHTSHIFRIDKVFKGDPKSDTIEIPIIGGELDGETTSVSHVVRLYRTGYSGILFLDTLKNAGKYISEAQPRNYPKWGVYSEPLNYLYGLNDNPPQWCSQVHPYLYPGLEEITGQAFRAVHQNTLQDSMIAHWLSQNNQDKLKSRQGLILYLTNYNINAKMGTTRFEIYGKSAFDFSYPLKMRFVFSYNPAVFGDSLVNKGLLKIDRDISHSGIGGHHIRHAYFPNYYDISAKDLSANKFELLIHKKNRNEPYVQLPGFKSSRNEPFVLPMVAFHLPIFSDSLAMLLRLENEPFDTNFTHFDFSQKAEMPYAYQYVRTETDTFSLIGKTKPFIKKIVPDSVEYESTKQVEIVGRNFYGNSTSVFITCCKRRYFKKHVRLCRLPDEYIKYRSGGHIKFILPSELDSGDKRLGKMQPCTGAVRIVNRIGELERWSETMTLTVVKPK